MKILKFLASVLFVAAAAYASPDTSSTSQTTATKVAQNEAPQTAVPSSTPTEQQNTQVTTPQSVAPSNVTMMPAENNACGELPDKDTLISGWYSWEPYQFNKITQSGPKLVGMDIWIVKYLASTLKLDISYDEVSWPQHQKDLQVGDRDMASGATYNPDRAKYAYFSIPYRFEEDSLFTSKEGTKKLSFSNIKEFLAQIRLKNYRLGVVDGFVYASPEINDFIKDETNRDIILKYPEDLSSLKALINNEIDGFICDRVVGSSIVFNNALDKRVEEVPLNVRTPIHLMFSKKTVPIDIVEKFNSAIAKFVDTKEYKSIVSTYLYSLLLLQTINADWFYIVGIIGTIAFAMSGVAIAAKENATLFGTLIFAMLPSVAGGVLRDLIINRDKVGILLTPSYMYIIVVIVILGFAITHLIQSYNKDSELDASVSKFWHHLLIVCDALGQASFIVTGVAIAMIGRIDPIELWGPFFAFLTANAGGIFRDMLKKDGVITCLYGDIDPEISVVWGLVFSMFLSYNAYNPDPEVIDYGVIVVVLGAFSTRLIAYYMNVPNLKFRTDQVKNNEQVATQQICTPPVTPTTSDDNLGK